MFFVSHFQKIGEGIFHFSLFIIYQYWTSMVFLKAYKADFSVYSIIDIEENMAE